MVHVKEQHNKRLDLIVEPGIQSLYERMMGEFPKIKAMIEEQRHLARTASKRYYHNWKVKNNVDK